MKKGIALFLSVLMLLCFGSALAEESVVHNAFNDFDFEIAVPEGYTLLQEQLNDLYLVKFIIPDEQLVNYVLSVSYSELYDGETLVNFSQEDKDLFTSLLALNYSNPTITEEVTPDGTLLIVLDESVETVDFVTIATIYEGYVFEMHIAHEDYAQVTEEEYQTGITIFNEIEML